MKELFHPKPEDMSLTAILYALSDPVRLDIVIKLSGCTHKCCGEFNISLAKSTLSHHFKTLRDAGIIQVDIDGTQRKISLRKDPLNKRFPGLLASILKVSEK
jgi:DNA-binding transcriptional ArsR family regulator